MDDHGGDMTRVQTLEPRWCDTHYETAVQEKNDVWSVPVYTSQSENVTLWRTGMRARAIPTLTKVGAGQTKFGRHQLWPNKL